MRSQISFPVDFVGMHAKSELSRAQPSYQDYSRLVHFASLLRYKSSPAFPGKAFEAPRSASHPAMRPVGPAFGCSKSLPAILSGFWVKLAKQLSRSPAGP